MYFLVHGLEEPPSSRFLYICDTDIQTELKQCDSLEDVTTCAGLKSPDGNVASCILDSCGYKLFDHIDISIAGTSDPYDPAAATATTSFVSVVSYFYGLVPYLIGFVYLVHFLASGDLVPFTRLFVFGVISIVNEGLFKHWIKQHRPVGSCLYFKSMGMPSGHSATSIGLLTYLLLELFVYHPNLLCELTCQRGVQRNAYSFKFGYGWQKIAVDSDVAGIADDSVAIGIENSGDNVGQSNVSANAPLLDINKASSTQSTTPASSPTWIYHLYAVGYILLLFPVPFSRVYLHDHLTSQILAGGAVGIVAASVWYLGFIRNCGMRVIEWRESEWGKWWGLKFGWEEGLF